MKNSIKTLAERIIQTQSVIMTEEATKNAYIMPSIRQSRHYCHHADQSVANAAG